MSVSQTAAGTDRLTVRLHPNELGAVQIQLERAQDGTTHVTVSAAKPETLALLQRDRAELNQALDQAGIPAEGRAISFHAAALPDSGPTQGKNGTGQDTAGQDGRSHDGPSQTASGQTAGDLSRNAEPGDAGYESAGSSPTGNSPIGNDRDGRRTAASWHDAGAGNASNQGNDQGAGSGSSNQGRQAAGRSFQASRAGLADTDDLGWRRIGLDITA